MQRDKNGKFILPGAGVRNNFLGGISKKKFKLKKGRKTRNKSAEGPIEGDTWRSGGPDKEKHTQSFEGEFFTAASTTMCGWRAENQDAHIVHTGNEYSIFAVFDGHGGCFVSKTATEQLEDVCSAHSISSDSSDEDFTKMMYALDQTILEKLGTGAREEGTTAVLGFLFPPGEDGKHTLKAVNVGDSRIVCSIADEISCTKDHRPNDPKEVERINAAGGTVDNGRVKCGDAEKRGNHLGLSRALGDFLYKGNKEKGPSEQVIVATPDVYTFKLSPNDFFIVACDGIWDVLSNEEVVTSSKQGITDDDLSKRVEMICDECLGDNMMLKGSDNITIMIVNLKGTGDAGAEQVEEEVQAA